MAHEQTIDHLNQLRHANKDAEAGFQRAAENVQNSELETVFSGYAKQHHKFATELEDEIRRLGGDLADPSTVGAAIHRGWMDLKSTLSGHSAASLLASCESGEESVESAYTDASNANPTGQTHTLIDKQWQQIKGFRARLARLLGETKDGYEFQQNE